MKKLLLLALCALLSLNADARTLYVDARRPNNNGNGRSLRKAKKTIQAAINIAKKGDTVLVYPGTYEDHTITTNNKKIRIKSKSGAARTEIRPKQFDWLWVRLGKTSKLKGTSTVLSGFTIYDGNLYGGTGKSCILRCGVHRSKLIGCSNYLSTESDYCSFSRCRFFYARWQAVSESTFADCLFAANGTLNLSYSTLVNCTLADNRETELVFVKAYNTIFYNVPGSQFASTRHNTLKSCYKGSNPKFLRPGVWDPEWYENNGWFSPEECQAMVAIGNYRLAKGSPCINKGTKVKAAKKLYGTKDLAGKKRVKGKSVDIGCYEY